MQKYIKAIIYCILTLPIVLTPFTIFPHHFGKVMIFLLAVGVGVIALLIQIWRTKQYPSFNNPLTMALVVWLLVMTIASLLGENFYRSLGGVYFRNTGLVLWVALFGFFILLNYIFTDKAGWRKMLMYFAGIGGVVGAVGVVQRFVTVWPGLIDQSGRIASTIGNPIFLGAYLLFIFFIALYLFITALSPKEKLIWIGVVVVTLLGLYFTESAGTFVGLIAGAAMMVAILIARSKKPKLIFGTVIVVVLMVLGGMVFLKYKTILLKSPIGFLLTPLDRVSLVSAQSGTAKTRLMAWGVGWQGIKARPILGWGMGNFETVADRYYNPKFLEVSFAETVWDTPHNLFIQIAAEDGVVGLLAFLAVIVCAYVMLYKNKQYSVPEKAILAGGLAAYLVQASFGVDTLFSLSSLIILLALFAAPRPMVLKPVSTTLSVFLPVGIVLIAGAVWSFAITPFRVSIYLNNADTAQIDQNDGEAWETNALKVMDYHGMYAGDFALALSRNILSWDGANNLPYVDLKKGFLTLIGTLENLAKQDPNHFNYHFYLGQLYQIRAEHGEKNYFSLAEKELFKALELSPNRQAASFVLGKAYFLANDFDKAAAELAKMVAFYPANLEAHLYYGLILSAKGEKDAAATQFIELVKANYKADDPNFLNKIGDILHDDKSYAQLANFYEIYVNHFPEKTALLLRLAEAEYLAGKRPLAEAIIAHYKEVTGNQSDIEAVWQHFKKLVK